jgi:murein DD-endopeptidase MepM/ murein hydrolase activator NlpD
MTALAEGKRVAAVTRGAGGTGFRAVLVASAASVLAIGLLVAAPSPGHASDINGQQKKVAAALAQASQDLDSSSAATTRAAAAYAAVQKKLTAAQGQLTSARTQLAGARTTATAAAADATAAREALTGAREQVRAAAADVAAQQGQIDQIVRLRYESGPSEDVTMLFGSGAPGAYLERAGLIEAVVRGRDDQLTRLQNDRLQLAAGQAIVRDRTAAVVARQQAADRAVTKVGQLVAQAAEATRQLGVLSAQRSATLAAASTALAADRAQVTQLQNESASIAALIRQREVAASQNGPVSSIRRGTEGLIYPVNGPITSGFGYRTDPVTGQYQLHAGIDFGVGTGTPIHAAKAGTVIFAGTETGYGNYTCIDHGGGFSTCYAHQSKIEVTVGQTVTQGEVIGLVGSTGYATGPHLHFETRVNGNPENPLDFL